MNEKNLTHVIEVKLTSNVLSASVSGCVMCARLSVVYNIIVYEFMLIDVQL